MIIIIALINTLVCIPEYTILLIGPTGVGKSFIANQMFSSVIQDDDIFVSQASPNSVTQFIEQKSYIITHEQETFKLTIVDTPGLQDSEGRGPIFLDLIMTYLQNNKVNMIFFVFQFGRMNENLRNDLLAVKECIGVFTSNKISVILNRTPNDYQLKKSKPPQTQEQVLQQTSKTLQELLGDEGQLITIIPIIEISSSIQEVEFEVSKSLIMMKTIQGNVDSTKIKSWRQVIQQKCDSNHNSKQQLIDSVNQEISDLTHEIQEIEKIHNYIKYAEGAGALLMGAGVIAKQLTFYNPASFLLFGGLQILKYNSSDKKRETIQEKLVEKQNYLIQIIQSPDEWQDSICRQKLEKIQKINEKLNQKKHSNDNL